MSSSDQRANSGVRNLRAMFENGPDSTTNDGPRGRSPAGAESVVSNGSTTPRHLSKVRTNFVAVEKTVPAGARTETPKTTAAEDGGSGDTQKADPAERQGLSKKSSIAQIDILSGKQKSDQNSQDEEAATTTLPRMQETPLSKLANGTTATKQAASPLPKPQNQSSRKTSQKDAVVKTPDPFLNNSTVVQPSVAVTTPAQENVKPIATKTDESPAKEHKMIEPVEIPLPPTPATGKAVKVHGTESQNDVSWTPVHKGEDNTPKSNAVNGSSYPSPVSAQKATRKQPGTGSATLNTPQQPAKALSHLKSPQSSSSSPKASSSKHTPVKVGPQKKGPPDPNSSQYKTHHPLAWTRRETQNAEKQSSSQTIPSSSQPLSASKLTKTPTRPARLPSSLTASTTSSAAKPSSDSNLSKGKAASRPTTTTRRPQEPSTSQAVNGARKSSRHSLPVRTPKPSADRPKSRISTGCTGQPDEGFLARMMRPTASSLSKTHEKLEIKSFPPPRRAATSATARPKVKRKSAGSEASGSKATSPEVTPPRARLSSTASAAVQRPLDPVNEDGVLSADDPVD